jgi:hypothetical protein
MRPSPLSTPYRNALLCALCCSLSLGQGCGDDEKSEPRPDAGEDEERDSGEPGAAEEDAAGGDGEQDAGGDYEDAGEPEQDAGAQNNKSRLKGRVTYADGTALGQVEVRIGDKRYKTDSRGVFSADDLPAGEQQLVVDDARSSRAQMKVELDEERVTQAELFVLPRKKAALSNVEAGAETSSDDNVKVKLPSGALRVKSTREPASGEAETRYAVAKQSSDLKAAPGRMRGTQADREVELESFGMVDVRLYQGDQELELTDTAELELPLGPNSFSDQQEVDAWSFDTASGRWKLENKALVDRNRGTYGVAKVKATHFSWWSVAQPVQEESCLSGRLLGAPERPLPYLWVQAVARDSWGSYWAQTDENGRFCMNVKPGIGLTLSAFATDDSSYLEWQQDVTSSSGAALCGGPDSCADLGDLSGISLFDECTSNVTHDQNRVLLLSSSDADLDMQLQTALQSHGHDVTLGPNYSAFDGMFDLSPYDAIYLQANVSWSGDMPEAGQRQLINWVNCGGGLLTVEWTTWKIGTGGFKLIDAIFPAVRTSAYSAPAIETFTRVTAEATLNAGLPDSFGFSTDNYGGTEANLNPRYGALVYYDSTMLDSGLLGWDYNLGRVASFSTTAGVNEVADPNFARLLANTLDWLQRD